MARCHTCGTTILFGGERRGTTRYCSGNCAAADELGAVAAELPEEAVRREALRISQAPCPECGRLGQPVTMWTSHRAMSFLVVTQWNSRPRLCCTGCGRKAILLDTLLTGVMGWWGFPWGFLVTPVQLLRNVYGLTPWNDHGKPASPTMLRVTARIMAAEGLERARALPPPSL